MNQTDERSPPMSPAVPNPEAKVIGYVMTREVGGTWMFLGTTPQEVGNSVAGELHGNEGLTLDEIDGMRIEAREFTQREIDSMPEFPGW